MKRLCPRGIIAQPNPQKARHHKSVQAEKDSSNPMKSSASASPYPSKPRPPTTRPTRCPGLSRRETISSATSTSVIVLGFSLLHHHHQNLLGLRQPPWHLHPLAVCAWGEPIRRQHPHLHPSFFQTVGFSFFHILGAGLTFEVARSRRNGIFVGRAVRYIIAGGDCGVQEPLDG